MDRQATPPGMTRTLADLREGRTSSVELLEQARTRAGTFASLNSLAQTDWEGALAQARASDARRAGGMPGGALEGIPVSIKDLFNVRGMPAQGGTRAPLPDLGLDEATLVARLREAGAIIFAKTNLHEVALGATGENVWTGDVCHPVDPARQAGGSSSGAAVAVACGIGLGAVGTDTGGSVRVPAAFCGVTGFKPTWGAIPLTGGLHLSWTCDHAGPLAATVADCARLFEVMAARSVRHGTVARAPRLAVPRRWLDPRLSDPVREVFESALARLAARGAVLVDVEVPEIAEAFDHYTAVVRAEAAWVHRDALDAGGAGFSEPVLAPLLAGRQLGAVRYIDGLQVRERLRRSFGRLLAGFDALALPTSPVLPPLRGSVDVEVARGQRMPLREAILGQTLAFSFAGLPALAQPMARAQGLPTSLQLVGEIDSDARLLALGQWVEDQLGAVGTGFSQG